MPSGPTADTMLRG